MNASLPIADATASDTLPFDGRPPSPERTRADAMARFENDAAFFDRIVPLFRQAVIDQSASLLASAERRDAGQVVHWAHTLKGSLLTVGANEVAIRAERLEIAARDGRLDALPAMAGRLAAEACVIGELLAPGGQPAR
jgi:HPt (histidine-containing phosphotransfer) domain-containing protein